MKNFVVTVTSECITAAGNTYNSDKREGQNNQEAQTAGEAIEKEIKNYRLSGKVEWYNEASCMVEIDLENGNKKDYFFDACEE